MKPANRNLLLLGIPALLILLAGIFLFLSGELLFRTAQLGMPEAPGSDVGDVEGYALGAPYSVDGAALLALAKTDALLHEAWKSVPYRFSPPPYPTPSEVA